MHQLWQHPNGVYYVLYGPRLKRRISTGSRVRTPDAENYLAQFIAGSQDPQPKEPTVGAIIEAYRDDVVRRVRSKQTLRFSTDVLLRRLGNFRPQHLTPATIKRYAAERGASGGSILREIGVLRASLAWALEHKWIATKPIISNPVKTPLPRDRWITKDEARRLIAGCTEPHVRTFVTVALMTAARMGAILEARWGQVDWEAKRLDFGDGHGNKRRSIAPLNGELERALRAAKELACSDFIIEYRGKPVFTVKNGFSAACRRAGLVDVTPHVLRHSAATWLAIDGVPLNEIARLLGDTEATVERVYAKHTPEFLRRATGALQLGLAQTEGALHVKGNGVYSSANVTVLCT